MTKDKIIDEEIRQAIKELSNLLDEFDLTEVQVENNKIGKTIATVKIYLDQVICNIGIVILKYLAKPSIIGSIIHADKFNKIAFIKKTIY